MILLLDPNLCAGPISDTFRAATVECHPTFAPWYHLPVGIFAILAGACAVMVAMKEHARWAWKGPWLLLIIVFTAAELRMIKWSDADARKEKEYSECKIQRNFQAIERENQATFRETMCEVSKVLDKTERVVNLSRTTLGNITGGGSYAYVIPSGLRLGRVGLVLQGNGANILIGVKVRISETKLSQPQIDDEHVIDIGSLPPYGTFYLPVELHPNLDPQTGLTNYHVEVSAQNGAVEETIELRKSKDDPLMIYACRLTATMYTPLVSKPGDAPRQKETNLMKTDWSDAVWIKLHSQQSK